MAWGGPRGSDSFEEQFRLSRSDGDEVDELAAGYRKKPSGLELDTSEDSGWQTDKKSERKKREELLARGRRKVDFNLDVKQSPEPVVGRSRKTIAEIAQ